MFHLKSTPISLEVINKITRGCHLLDSRWNGLFLIICQKNCFYPLAYRTRVPKLATRACKSTYDIPTMLNISLKNLNHNL